MGEFADRLQRTIEESTAKFDQQFLASREAQRPEFWLAMLAASVTESRSAASNLTAESVTVDSVLELIVSVAVMAATVDFCTKRFGDEIRGKSLGGYTEHS